VGWVYFFRLAFITGQGEHGARDFVLAGGSWRTASRASSRSLVMAASILCPAGPVEEVYGRASYGPISTHGGVNGFGRCSHVQTARREQMS
jgi:hypothetical protein